MRKITSLLLATLLSPVAFADGSFEVMASSEGYNRLMFPVPFQKIVIPPDAQLQEKPISLKDNLGLLLRPSENARPINVFVQLVDGQAFTVRLLPSSSPIGAVFRYGDADDASAKPEKEGRPNDGWIADVFVKAAQGEKPSGFERKEGLMPVKVFVRPQIETASKEHNEKALNQIDMTPVAHYVGSGYSLKLYRLHAKKMINVEPRDFFRSGIIASAIDGDVISPIHNPLIIVLEAKNDGR